MKEKEKEAVDQGSSFVESNSNNEKEAVEMMIQQTEAFNKLTTTDVIFDTEKNEISNLKHEITKTPTETTTTTTTERSETTTTSTLTTTLTTETTTKTTTTTSTFTTTTITEKDKKSEVFN